MDGQHTSADGIGLTRRLPSLRLSSMPLQLGLGGDDEDHKAHDAHDARVSRLLSRPADSTPLSLLGSDNQSPPMARPPTPGGGPLSSHPANPALHPGSFTPPPPSSSPSTERRTSFSLAAVTRRQSVPLSSPVHVHRDERARRASEHLLGSPDFRTDVPARKPLATSSANITTQRKNTPLKRSHSTGVRKLLGLGGAIRSSFSSSSHTSLVSSGPPSTPPSSGHGSLASAGSRRRPSSPPGLISPVGSTTASQHSYTATVSSVGPHTPRLKKKKSDGWFRRSSLFLNLGGDYDGHEQEARHYTTVRGSIVHLGPDSAPRGRAVPVLPELTPPTHKTWAEGLFASLQR